MAMLPFVCMSLRGDLVLIPEPEVPTCRSALCDMKPIQNQGISMALHGCIAAYLQGLVTAYVRIVDTLTQMRQTKNRNLR